MKLFIYYIRRRYDMSLLGNTEYIKTKSGDYIEIRRGMFHTHVTMPDGSELELDTDYDELIKILEIGGRL